MGDALRITLELPAALVRDAQLYAGTEHAADAVSRILSQHADLVAQNRQLRRRLDQLDAEEAAFDDRLQALQSASRAILDL